FNHRRGNGRELQHSQLRQREFIRRQRPDSVWRQYGIVERLANQNTQATHAEIWRRSAIAATEFLAIRRYGDPIFLHTSLHARPESDSACRSRYRLPLRHLYARRSQRWGFYSRGLAGDADEILWRLFAR